MRYHQVDKQLLSPEKIYVKPPRKSLLNLNQTFLCDINQGVTAGGQCESIKEGRISVRIEKANSFVSGAIWAALAAIINNRIRVTKRLRV